MAGLVGIILDGAVTHSGLDFVRMSLAAVQ